MSTSAVPPPPPSELARGTTGGDENGSAGGGGSGGVQAQQQDKEGKQSPTSKIDEQRPYDNMQAGGPPPNYYMDPKRYPRPPGPPNGRFTGGPTPTLNQLLQSPQRSPAGFSGQEYPPGPQGWHGRPPFPHQVQAQTFRPPVHGQPMEGPPSPKRPPSNGPPQQGPPPGAPYARNYPQVMPRTPYHPTPQRESRGGPGDDSSNESNARGASPASNAGSRSMSPSGYPPNHGAPPPEGYPGGTPNAYGGGPPNKMPLGPQAGGPAGQYPPMGFPQGFPPRPGYGPPGAQGYGQYPRFPQQGYPPGPPGQVYHQGGPPPGHPGGMMPPPSQYGYPPPRGGPPPPNVTAGGPGGPPQGSPSSPRHPGGHPAYLRQHLQQKIYGYSSPMTPPMQDGAHPTGPQRGSPSPAPDRSMSPRANGPSVPPEKTSSSQPPSAFDEGSQASNASASSSTNDDSSSNQMPPSASNNSNNNQGQNRLHPGGPTPSPRSMSSFPEDYDGGANSRSPAPSPLPQGQQAWPPHPQGFPAGQPPFHSPGSAPPSNNTPTTPSGASGGGGSSTRGSNSIQKQYELGSEPERKDFIDRILRFNDEKGTAITTNPTISKQPLDLYRLYIIVRDRGGFMEVTKQKAWKDIAGLLNVGASGSAAYTLRKQYTKHVLPYECKFDRGNIDPQPIINSLESPAARKKKNANAAVSSPQEPNANSNPAPTNMPPGQYHPDYPGGGPPPLSQPLGGPPVCSYPSPQGYPEGRPPTGYPPGHPANQGHPGQHPGHPGHPVQHPGVHPGPPPGNYPPQGPPQHPGMDPAQYPPGYPPGYLPRGHSGPPQQPPQNYPHSQSPHGNGPVSHEYQQVPPQPIPSFGPPPPGGQPQQHHQSPQPTPPPTAAVSPFPDKPPTPQSQPPQSPASLIQSRSQSPAMPSPRTTQTPGPPQSGAPPNIEPPPSPHVKQEGQPLPQPGQQAQGAPAMPQPQSVAPNQQGPPPQGLPGQGPPQHYPGYPPHSMPGGPHMGQPSRPPMQGGGYPNMQGHHQGMPPNPQQMNDGPPPNRGPPFEVQKPFPQPQGHNGPLMRGYPPGPPGPPNMQNHPRQDFYGKRHPDFMKEQGPYGQPQAFERGPPGMPGYPPQPGSRQGPSNPPGNLVGWNARPPWGNGPPPNADWMNSGSPNKMGPPYMGGAQMGRVGPPQPYMLPKMPPPHMGPNLGPRKDLPSDCVEAVAPSTMKRRRVFAKDVAPVDAWRLMMSLKSGLLAESTWALDVISILLYDDSSILYFGLQHLPGFLETLLEHYRKCLSEMFGITDDLELGFDYSKLPEDSGEEDQRELPWFLLEKDISRKSNEKPQKKVKLTKEAPMLDLSFAKRNTITQDGKPVKIRDRPTPSSLLKLLEAKDIDVPETWEDFAAGYDHWANGAGEITSHIHTHFESERQNVRFCRLLKSKHDDDDGYQWAFDLHEEQRAAKKMTKEEDVETEIDSVLQNGIDDDDFDDNDTIDSTSIRKRRREVPLDDEAYMRDEPSLCTVTDQQESLGKRTTIISTIIRNLSFVPGNEIEFARHPGVLLIIGRMLLLNHKHNSRKPRTSHSKESVREAAEADAMKCESADLLSSNNTGNTDDLEQCCSLTAEDEWWWEHLAVLRENSLVTLANISTHLDLGPYPEEISLPILDGLLHWAVCESACARDPLSSTTSSSISLQRLAVESLCKLSVLEVNVDLMLATPPWSRIERLIGQLSKWLARGEDQVIREFAVVLISNMVAADNYVARAVACAGNTVSHLMTFVEQAEQSALSVANQQGINALRDNPELMGTTLDMVRRAAGTLKILARVPENRQMFVQQQQRLLTLVMSQILDQGVAANVADVLYQVSQCDVPPEPAFEPRSEIEQEASAKDIADHVTDDPIRRHDGSQQDVKQNGTKEDDEVEADLVNTINHEQQNNQLSSLEDSLTNTADERMKVQDSQKESIQKTATAAIA